MFLSETEGTGIKLSETEGTGMSFSESEGTDLKTDKVPSTLMRKLLNISCLLLFGQFAMADVGYIHETKQDGVYEGMIVDNAGNNALFEGVIENNQFTGFITQIDQAVAGLTESVDDGTGGNTTDSVDDGTGGYSTDSVDDGTGGGYTTDSVDDGTGGYTTDSVDDGTGGGILDSVDDGTGNLISIQLTCDLNNNFEVSVESGNSLAAMVNFDLTSLYFNGVAISCNN
jgi:hypothetical protein